MKQRTLLALALLATASAASAQIHRPEGPHPPAQPSGMKREVSSDWRDCVAERQGPRASGVGLRRGLMARVTFVSGH